MPTHTANVNLARHYVCSTSITGGLDIVMDACMRLEPGARAFLEWALLWRRNPRTRRTITQVGQAARYARTRKARWFTVLLGHLETLFRTLRKMSLPIDPATSHLMPSGTAALRVAARMGQARSHRVPIKTQATTYLQGLWEHLAGRQFVLWADNWYVRRYGTNPDGGDPSLNVTVMTLLDVSAGQAQQTRAVQFPSHTGHGGPSRLVMGLEAAVDSLMAAIPRLYAAGGGVTGTCLVGAMVRVPLDLAQQGASSVPWRPWMLTQHRIGDNDGMVGVLELVRETRQRMGMFLPLRVDENVHYRVCRLLCSPAFQRWNVQDWLSGVPLLLGCGMPTI